MIDLSDVGLGRNINPHKFLGCCFVSAMQPIQFRQKIDYLGLMTTVVGKYPICAVATVLHHIFKHQLIVLLFCAHYIPKTYSFNKEWYVLNAVVAVGILFSPD